ncbi:DNA oxidative demethylase protein [Dioscorea alata]|uniref:DNA oxidative demethylase protein n=1 Tax=Dioscorea alata TaxID=55571 RepID=A0ACB7TXI5_DIOAL|nr:DNA oxidative demethylase protein [Dioscorea alata]
MERRKPNASTAGLLAWPEKAPEEVAVEAEAGVVGRPRLQPPDKVGAVLFGGQVSEEEAESLMKRKPCSGPKLKEMTGSGIFSTESQDGAAEYGSPGSRPCQQAAGVISQISFSADENVSPKKPTTLTEMAKQRELSGNLADDSDSKMKKLLSDAKCKELTGHDIFGPPPEITPKSLNKHASVNISTSAGFPGDATLTEEEIIKTSKKIHNQKFQDLFGNNIFKEEDAPSSALTDKTLSPAKLKEMSGSDIFADGKAATRDYLGGVRKPPGGGSSLTLL